MPSDVLVTWLTEQTGNNTAPPDLRLVCSREAS